jgi:hypothetical protein
VLGNVEACSSAKANKFFFFVYFVGFLGGKQVDIKVYMEILKSSSRQEIPGRKKRPKRRVCTHTFESLYI